MGIYTVTNFFFLGLHLMEKSISKPTREYLFGIPLIVFVSLLIISNYWISLSETIQNLKKKCAKKGQKVNEDISKIDKTAKNSTSQQCDLMNSTGSGLNNYGNQSGLAKSVAVPGISAVKLQNDLVLKKNRVRATTDKKNMSDQGSIVNAQNKKRQPSQPQDG